MFLPCPASFLRSLSLLLPVLLLASGCTSMKLKMDSAWEQIDPMGHRRIHQEQNFARGRSTGVRLPGNSAF